MTAVRLQGATSGPNVIAAYAYDDLGRRVSTTRGNSVVTRYGYDGASRLTSLAHDYPSAQDVSQTLSYNPAGQILSEVTTPALYELPISGSSTVDYADNKLHQYTSVGGEAVSHDLDGARHRPRGQHLRL